MALLNATAIVLKWSNGGKQNALVFVVAFWSILVVFEVALHLSKKFWVYSELSSGGTYTSFLQKEIIDSWFWVRQPNFQFTSSLAEFEFNRNTNSLGLSEVDIPPKSSANRVIGLGDSFTEGTGVPQDSTWLRKLELLLNASGPVKYEIYNAGISGSDPIYEYMLLERKLLSYRPDLIIVSINASDFGDLAYRGGFERFHEDGTSGREAPKWEWLYKNSHLLRMILHNGFKYNYYLMSPKQEAKANEAAFEDMTEVIGRFEKLALDNRFKLLFVIHPLVYEFNYESKHSIAMDRLVHWLSASSHLWIDIGDCFVENGVDSPEKIANYYWPKDRHFNQQGYDFYANCVAEEVLVMLEK